MPYVRRHIYATALASLILALLLSATMAPAARRDTQPPTTSITAGPADGAVDTDGSVSFSFSGTDNRAVDHFEVKNVKDGVPEDWVRSTSPKSYTGLENGSYVFKVRAVDTSGNVDATPATRSYTVNIPVVVPGEVLWSGDAENPTGGDWSRIHTKPPYCNAAPQNGIPPNDHGGYHARVTSSPVPLQGTYAYRGKVDDSYDCSQERTELTQLGDDSRQFHRGDETWEAFVIWLGSDFNVNRDSQGASTLFQHKPVPSDNPTSSLKVGNGNWLWTTQGGSPTNPAKDTINVAPAQRQVWCKFVIHTVYQPDDTGLAELYTDCRNPGGSIDFIARYQKPSLYTDSTSIRVNMGFYREASDTGTETFANDGYTVGTTRAIVEQSAF